MIQSKNDLMEYLAADNAFFRPQSGKEKLVSAFAGYPAYRLTRYLVYLRKQEYYINTAHGSKLRGLLGLYYERKKNKLGERLGIEIGPNCFGRGLQLYHYGNVIVNPAVRAGENCKLHGGNCIGNNGKTEAVPTLGDNVDIGFGAVLIGGITIADDVTIGANAVINKSVEKPGAVVVGVPGKAVR